MSGPCTKGEYDQQLDASPRACSPSLVQWLTPVDKHDPRQWKNAQKWTIVILISIQGILSPMASTLPVVAARAIASDFDTTSSITPTLPVAIALWSAASLHHKLSGLALLNVGCALAPNITALIILRLLSGISGSAGPSLGDASIGDMFIKSERGKARALYGLGPTFGPVLGGVLGGFILYGTNSWRWLMWVTVIAPAITVSACIFFLRETYAPVLLRKRARALTLASPGRVFYTEYDDINIERALLLSITRPLRMLVTNPICASMAVYIGMVYGILYLFLLSLSLLFGPEPSYGLFTPGWTYGTSGLSFLGVGCGTLLGSFLSALYANKIYAWRVAKIDAKATEDLQAAHNTLNTSSTTEAESQPESRLFLLQLGMVVLPLGLIIYAWSAGRTHWVVPLLGAILFSTAMIVVYVAFQTYIVDIFG